MIKKTYRLQLASPAFLGDADQKGTWRTPPLKALIREWWRIAVAPQVAYEVGALKTQEKGLFGTAADDGSERNERSQIRLALKHWNEGRLTDWTQVNPAQGGKPGIDPKVSHKEVQFGGGMVGSQLYLGYGPLVLEKGNPNVKLKNGAALQAKEDENTLKLAHPEEHDEALTLALTLAHWFGTIGGRSRNGWGSLSLQPVDEGTAALDGQLGGQLALPWQDALQRDWPHALGTDTQGPLVWQTRAFDDWKKLMQEMARIKIALRTQFKFHSGKDAMAPEARHWLSYPVTNHSVKSWGGNARLPNSLRFKVRPAPGNPQQVVGVIFHVPCLPPPAFQPEPAAIQTVWQTVHRHLDNEPQLTRIPA